MCNQQQPTQKHTRVPCPVREEREREGGETHHYHSANIHHPENDDDDDDDADFGSGDDICQLINKMWDTLQQQQKNQLCVLVVIPHKQGQTSLPTLAHSSPELPTHTRANWVNDIKIGRTHTTLCCKCSSLLSVAKRQGGRTWVSQVKKKYTLTTMINC